MFSFFDKTFGKWMKPTSDKGMPVHLAGTSLIIPTDTQARAVSPVMTHNAAPIAASSASIPATWTDTQDEKNPFTEFEVTLLNDAATSSSLDIFWSHDASAISGISNVLLPGTSQRRSNDWDKSIKVKAKWMKVVPYNNDTAAQHTMTVNILTKA